MACSKQRGFSLPELLVSVAITTLIATITVVNLFSSQRKEELKTAQRVLAADIRSLQTRALTAQNVQTCTALGKTVACELNTSVCDVPTSCAPMPPYAVGMLLQTGLSTYPFFADVDVSNKDGKDTSGASEETFLRNFAKMNAPNVQITGILANGAATPIANLSFSRQNGQMNIWPCSVGICLAAQTLTITLTQTQSGDTATVSVNAITGRVSVD